MLTANGFCCSLVDAKEHTREINPHGHIVETKQWNMASIWIGGEPSESEFEPPLVVGIYVGRESAEATNVLPGITDNDCMVYVFKNGIPLAKPVLLSALRRTPMIIPRNKTLSCYRSSPALSAPLYQSSNNHHDAHHISMSLSELEVIIVTPFTPPKPMMGIEEYPQSKHLAHFRFTLFPTQILDVRGIAIIPKGFWVHERLVSKEWVPFRRKPLSSKRILGDESQWTVKPFL